MSLAAQLATDGMRPASFVPVVKCSHCGQEIEIASMGSHVCNNTLLAPAAPDCTTHADAPPRSPAQAHYSICNPYDMKRLSDTGHQSVHAPSPPQHSQQPDEPVPPMPDGMQNRSEQHPTLPPSMTMPTVPRIGTPSMNKSMSGPRRAIVDRSNSPAMSASSRGSGRRPLLRSKTPPQLSRPFDDRPPSECMSPNLDCAFPPFPTTNNNAAAKRKPSQRKAPAALNLLAPRGSSKHGRGARMVPENSSEPKSPLTYAGENALQRMGSLQSVRLDDARSTPNSNDTPRSGSTLQHRRPNDSNALGIQSWDGEKESTSGEYDQADSRSPMQPYLAVADEVRAGPPARPARPTSSDVLSPAFLRSLSDDAPITTQTANIKPQSPHLPLKSPERAHFPRCYGDFGSQKEPAHAQPEHSPNQESLAQQGTSVPARMLRQDSAHTPSQSGSSTGSSTHSAVNSNSTNAASPVGSATSSLDFFSPTPYSGPTFGEDGKGSGFRMPEEPGMRAELPARRSPPRNFARPAPTVSPEDFELPESSVPRIVEPLESPTDPALQTFSRIQHPSHEPAMRPPILRTQAVPVPEHVEPTLPRMSYEPPPRLTIQTDTPSMMHEPTLPQLHDELSPSISNTPTMPRIVPPPPPPEPVETPAHFPTRQSSLRDLRRNRSVSNAGQLPRHTPRPSLPPGNLMVHTPRRSESHGRSGGPVQPPARRPTTANKSHCRGCHELIEGKSVKASDGRLTGRWHRACFTCTTCRQPFETADFYVFKDQPYCERHYHEKNGSLCQGCNHGIEGQYLEASTMTRRGRIDKKYHPRCFTCTQCREVLSDDYYEFRGRVFCQRHAHAAMRSQTRPGGLGVPDQRSMRAERRTTRLMMMGPGSIPGLS